MEKAGTERAIEHLAISKEDLACELLPEIKASMADYLVFDQNNDPHIDLSRCTREQLAAIKSVQIDEYLDRQNGDYDPETGKVVPWRMRRTKLQLRERVPSATLLARLFSWISAAPRPEPPTSTEERLRR